VISMLIQNMTRLKTCKWCGKNFRVPLTRKFNATKYCCIKCSTYAKLEQNLQSKRRYDQKYKHLQKTQLGTKGLGQHRHKDFQKELQAIQNELKKMGLK